MISFLFTIVFAPVIEISYVLAPYDFSKKRDWLSGKKTFQTSTATMRLIFNWVTNGFLLKITWMNFRYRFECFFLLIVIIIWGWDWKQIVSKHPLRISMGKLNSKTFQLVSEKLYHIWVWLFDSLYKHWLQPLIQQWKDYP